MYQLTIGNKATFLATLGDVLVALNDRRYGDPVPALDTICVTREGKPLEVVFGEYETFGVRQTGSGREIFEAMVTEVEQNYLKPSGTVLMPYELTKGQWAAVMAVSDTATRDYPCFTAEQIAERSSIERNGKTVEVDLRGLANAVFMQRFGYGASGPAYNEAGHKDSRHEYHVGYALVAGKSVPEHVLADCAERLSTESSRGTGYGAWYAALLRFPELRGVMSMEKLRSFCSALERGKITLSNDNVDMLTDLVKGMPQIEPTAIQVEDHLYQAGIIKPREVGVPAPLVVEDAYSDLALRLVENVQAFREEQRRKYVDEERAQGRLSLRDYDFQIASVKAGDSAELLALQNETAKAVAEKDLPTLLDLLDRSDDQNPATKRTLAQHVGLKLKGLKAAERRLAIFEFCCCGPEQRAEWEASWKAEQAVYKIAESGEVISGKEYVDRAIREGKTKVTSYQKGRSKHYYLVNPANGRSTQLGVKDGTLAYAEFTVTNTLATAIAA